MIAVVRGRRAQLIVGWIVSAIIAESIAVTFAFATFTFGMLGVVALAAALVGAIEGVSMAILSE